MDAGAQWAATPSRARSELLRRAFDLLVLRTDDFARSITAEMGKTIGEATGEVDKLATAFHCYAEEATRVHGEVSRTTPTASQPRRARAGRRRRRDHAVELPAGAHRLEACAALAAGCTIVVKPSPYASLSPSVLFSCIDEAGLPPGVANLVSGDDPAGPALAGHPGSTSWRSPVPPRPARRSLSGSPRTAAHHGARRVLPDDRDRPPTSRPLRPAPPGAGSATRARSASRSTGSTSRSRCATSSSPASPSRSRRSPSATAWTRASTWARWPPGPAWSSSTGTSATPSSAARR